MTPEQRVIACVDQSAYADTVTDHAAWAALQMGAPLELLHVIDRHPETAQSSDRSGAIGPDAQQALLTQLSQEDEARVRAAREQGRLFLNRLRERALAAGVPVVDVRQRLGHLDETLQEVQNEARLVVMGRRGASAAEGERSLGSNVESVVRALARPILTVGKKAFKAPERVLLAFDGSAITRKGVEMVAGSPLFRGLPVHLVMAGLDASSGQKDMDWAVAHLREGGIDAQGICVPGEPQEVILRSMEAQGADWLLMGAYTHSPWRKLFSKSRTSGLLASVGKPTLLLR
jgi:nucleotide-binding universal stress UspA family protein